MKQAVKPTVSGDGKTYVYDLAKDTCGIVVSVGGDKIAADYDVPAVRVLTAEVWKKMDVEIEWGFDPAAAEKDYSGRIETYDGIVAGLRPLDGDGHTTAVEANSWRSVGEKLRPSRREIQPAVHGHVEVAARSNRSRASATTWREPSSRCGPRRATSPSWRPTWRTGRSWRPSTDSLSGGRRSSLRLRIRSSPSRPFALASQAASAAEFIKELKARNLSTIRQQTPRP